MVTRKNKGAFYSGPAVKGHTNSKTSQAFNFRIFSIHLNLSRSFIKGCLVLNKTPQIMLRFILLNKILNKFCFVQLFKENSLQISATILKNVNL